MAMPPEKNLAYNMSKVYLIVRQAANFLPIFWGKAPGNEKPPQSAAKKTAPLPASRQGPRILQTQAVQKQAGDSEEQGRSSWRFKQAHDALASM
jgi:hypothetical protein